MYIQEVQIRHFIASTKFRLTHDLSERDAIGRMLVDVDVVATESYVHHHPRNSVPWIEDLSGGIESDD